MYFFLSLEIWLVDCTLQSHQRYEVTFRRTAARLCEIDRGMEGILRRQAVGCEFEFNNSCTGTLTKNGTDGLVGLGGSNGFRCGWLAKAGVEVA